jgi:Putative peptidoglycan binding domain/Transglycosylase SLT domain
MSFVLVYPPAGRGAWPSSGLGGTLNAGGTKAGSYYRAPAVSSMRMPGLAGAIAVRSGTACSINDYAVHRAVQALQPKFGITGDDADGILGPGTSQAIRYYQRTHGLLVDGAVGPATCRALFEPAVIEAAFEADSSHAGTLRTIVVGTMTVESGFDPGAVGVETPRDLGIAQINGPAHPSMSVDARLDPAIAIPWMVRFIDDNLKSFEYDVDAAIAAYNLGVSGSWAWVKAGYPQWYRGRDVHAYVTKIKEAGTPA